MSKTAAAVLLSLSPLAGATPSLQPHTCPETDHETRSYPRQITAGVNSYNHGRWPVRVQRFTHIAWRARIGNYVGMPMPDRTGNRIYVAGGEGGLHLIDGSNGRILWGVHGIQGKPNHSSSVIKGDVSFVSFFGDVRAVDGHGRCLWRTQLDAGWFHSPPTLSPTGMHLFVGGERLGVACLEAGSGKELWRYRVGISGATNEYCFDPRGNVIVRFPDKIVCLDGKGKELWSVTEAVVRLMLVGPRLICHQGKQVMNLHLDDMKWRWRKNLNGNVVTVALGAGNSIVCALDTGELVALDVGGKELWRGRISRHGLLWVATTIDGEVLVQDRAGTLHLYAPTENRILAQVATKAWQRWYRPVIDSQGRVLLSQQNSIVCLSAGRCPRPVTKVHVVADDFVVDVWINGKLVEDSRRHMLTETFGAMGEVVQTRLQPGDWIVFNVVNNRLRWNGVSYFGACGMDETGDIRFWSRPGKGWYACDDPAAVREFIAKRDAGTDQKALAPESVWGHADRIWQDTIHTLFPGEPVWGRKRNTWIKHIMQ